MVNTGVIAEKVFFYLGSSIASLLGIMEVIARIKNKSKLIIDIDKEECTEYAPEPVDEPTSAYLSFKGKLNNDGEKALAIKKVNLICADFDEEKVEGDVPPFKLQSKDSQDFSMHFYKFDFINKKRVKGTLQFIDTSGKATYKYKFDIPVTKRK